MCMQHEDIGNTSINEQSSDPANAVNTHAPIESCPVADAETDRRLLEELLARERAASAAAVARVRQLETLCEELTSKEQTLQEANRRMDELLSIVSHELKSPLAAIKGNVQLANRRLRP